MGPTNMKFCIWTAVLSIIKKFCFFNYLLFFWKKCINVLVSSEDVILQEYFRDNEELTRDENGQFIGEINQVFPEEI